MRIGLYGMPASGKSYIMDRIDFLDVLVGSRLLREYDPGFDHRDQRGREKDRKDVAKRCQQRDDFIMDGHYAFGDEIAFTEEEGAMYDRYLYLYIDPAILMRRMAASEKDRKYLQYDIAAWQRREMDGLREFCHRTGKDFYVIDNPAAGFDSEDVDTVLSFIREIREGYSCAAYAERVADRILSETKEQVITILDGDRTWIREDSSSTVFGYTTCIYDGNFYTGYQAWRQDAEFAAYEIDVGRSALVHRNDKLPDELQGAVYIVSAGNRQVWQAIAERYEVPVFAGRQVAAETKLYLVRHLQDAGRKVIAYGDSMGDYAMLQQADEGYLVTRADGSLSRSLRNVAIGGVHLV